MRAQVEFYERGTDAAVDAVALREVGMGRRSVSAVWVEAADTVAVSPWEDTIDGGFRTDFGTVRVLGWLGLTAERRETRTISEIVRQLEACDVDPKLGDRIETVLRSGGGLVAVRAQDDVTV